VAGETRLGNQPFTGVEHIVRADPSGLWPPGRLNSVVRRLIDALPE